MVSIFELQLLNWVYNWESWLDWGNFYLSITSLWLTKSFLFWIKMFNVGVKSFSWDWALLTWSEIVLISVSILSLALLSWRILSLQPDPFDWAEFKSFWICVIEEEA